MPLNIAQMVDEYDGIRSISEAEHDSSEKTFRISGLEQDQSNEAKRSMQ